jgi:hypothetical protein
LVCPNYTKSDTLAFDELCRERMAFWAREASATHAPASSECGFVRIELLSGRDGTRDNNCGENIFEWFPEGTAIGFGQLRQLRK